MNEVTGRRWWALGALVLAALTLGLDGTILNVALPTLAASVHASNSQLQWMADAYILVFAGLLIPAGALGDRFGRKRLILVGLALFGVASLGAAMTHDAGQLIAARAVMGLGAAILMPLIMAVLPVLFEESERARAIALMTVGIGVGVPLGPLVGGWLLEHFWWGSVFLVNVPVVVLALAAVGWFIPESKDPAAPRVDAVGGVLSTVGLVSFVYGIIEGPGRGWTDPLVIGTLAVGILALVAFARDQRKPGAMIDLKLFADRRFLWGTIAATLASFALFGLLFVLPQDLQVVRGNSAFGTGLRLLPLMVGIIAAAKLAEWLVNTVGNKIPVAAGLAVLAAGLTWAAASGESAGYGVVGAWLAVVGFGTGLGLTPAMHAILGALPPTQAGSGSALGQAFRQVGAALGVAVLGSVLAAAYTGALPHGTPAAARESVAVAVGLAARLGDPGLARDAGHAFAHAMSVVFVVCAIAAAIGAGLAARYLPARAPRAAGEAESDHELTGSTRA